MMLLRRFSSNVQHKEARIASLGGVHPGPLHWAYRSSAFPNTLRLKDLLSNYSSLAVGERRPPEEAVRVAGRVRGYRAAGKKLKFLDVQELDQASGEVLQLQVLLNTATLTSPNAQQLAAALAVGDLVGLAGPVGRAPAGTITLYATELQLLSPCLDQIPEKLEHGSSIARNRVLHMLVNPHESVKKLCLRSQIVNELRKAFQEEGFLEVETPILWSESGGAIATPFETKTKNDSRTLQMRIAPELFLKQLIVAGFTDVFEIGKVFRNEGVDATHNVEFTVCEAYKAFADYRFMQSFTEKICRRLGRLVGSDIFETTFKEIHVVPFINQKLKDRGSSLLLPCDESINEESSLQLLHDIASELEVEVPKEANNAAVFDALIESLIEVECQDPTFIMFHPKCLSPLAKAHPEFSGLTERFEFFVRGKELCNAYSELNDPVDQLKRFQIQSANKDGETHPLDFKYCEILELGLPPTAGWGLGIDRMVMMLLECAHIREVLTFPLNKVRTEPSK